MPFNDYWIDPPALPSLPLVPMAIIAGSLVLVAALAAGRAGLGWGIAGAVAALALAAWGAYRVVMARGARAFPAGPDTDLPTILKALFLQQQFARFAIAQQGAAPAALHAAFGAFLDATRPHVTDGPTQPPGALRS